MALVIADRVRETTAVTGTGSATLLGAVTGYQSFSVIGNGSTTYYTIADQGGPNWEVGIGVWSTGNTLARNIVLSSSNGGALVSFPVGTKDVFLTYPSEKAVALDLNGNVTANAYFNGFNSTAAGGATVVLTAASAPVQLITGSGSQTFQLPDATTIPAGTIFSFNNNSSSGSVSINNNSSTLVASVPSGGYITVVSLSNATAAGTWDKHFQAPSNVSWSTNTFSYPGSITSATWNGNAVGALYGGTGTAGTLTGYVYANGTGAMTATLGIYGGSF